MSAWRGWFYVSAVLLLYSHGSHQKDLDSVISKLAQKVAESQVRKHSVLDPYKKQIGVYPCNIHLNFNGNEAAKLLRDFAAVFDNNAFVTLWVSVILLEAAKFNKGPQPTQDQLKLSIETVASYHDRNRHTDSGILVFWPQELNSTSNRYYCNPENLEPIAEDMDDFLLFLHKVLDDAGLEKFWEETLAGFMDMIHNAFKAFHIPADFDDTFVNLGFGAMLSQYGDGSLHQLWKRNNTNFVAAINALKYYAYKPFSTDPKENFIDTRTFFYMREYLFGLKAEHPAAFATTWVQNIEEDNITKNDVAMPFHANNIDLTVSTNVLYGISSSILSGANGTDSDTTSQGVNWFNDEVQVIYENTTSMIAWFIQRNFSDRPDLALTYYPSVFNFYWFTARSLNLLRTHKVKYGNLPYAVMERAMDTLSEAMRGAATNDLVEKAVVDSDGLVYFDDFLGENDRTILGKAENSAEDRLCSTAVAVNTLLYTWTENQKLLPNTPQKVLTVINNACQWLVKYALSGKYKAYNVIFSGSVKTADDLPFFYPAKDLKYLNGTNAPPNGNPDDGADLMIGIHGVVSEQEYQKMLTEKHFGRYTPMDFHGYNAESAWPFWSSQPFTYASAMLALTQYRALQDQLNNL